MEDAANRPRLVGVRGTIQIIHEGPIVAEDPDDIEFLIQELIALGMNREESDGFSTIQVCEKAG